MVIDFPDGIDRREGELWRKKLTVAEQRYSENRNHENLAEFKRILKIFADLVIRNNMPP
jgi:hypothetical protein